MKKITYLLALLALILAGCSGNSSTSSTTDDSPSSSSIGIIPEMSSPAYSSSSDEITQSTTSNANSSSSLTVSSKVPIVLYKLNGLAKTLNVTASMNAIPYSVDLDTIYGTTKYSFIIENSGTSDITGLKFEFDLPYFKVSPDSIITLSAPGSTSGIKQLITVTIEHGKLASGIGDANVLTGNQYGTLTITGKNADGDFSIDYVMHVYAKRMIIHIDTPDTLMDGYYNGDDGVNPADENAYKYKYAYVDESSENCYLSLHTYSNLNIMLTSANTKQFNNMTTYYLYYTTSSNETSIYTSYKALNSDANIVEGAELYNKQLIARRLIATNQATTDFNCVVMIDDMRDDFQYILNDN